MRRPSTVFERSENTDYSVAQRSRTADAEAVDSIRAQREYGLLEDFVGGALFHAGEELVGLRVRSLVF